MPVLDTFLRRLRPLVAPPGTGGPAAVPVDHARDLESELAGVFASIDAIDDAAERLVAEARAEADHRLSTSSAEAARIDAEALDRAGRGRAAAYLERRTDHQDAIRNQRSAAETRASEIAEIAKARRAEMTEAVLRCVMQQPAVPE